MGTVMVQPFECLRCNWVWLPRYKDVGVRPKVCPKCKSWVWDKPRLKPKALDVASPGSNGGEDHAATE
mgnify:FL=1